MIPPNSSIADNHKRFLVGCAANEVDGCRLFPHESADLASEIDAGDRGAVQT
jgi:hypothetical protein